jgi:large subunit ribosomal protein L13
MDAQSYKTRSLKQSEIKQDWYIVDAAGQTLGRLSSRVAYVLRGKHKTSFTPHMNCGDNVIVINADKIRVTGRKLINRVHLRHTGYPGGQREETLGEVKEKNPALLIERAVKGMLPKTILGNDLYRNLYVYAGDKHPHSAQEPKVLKFN